MAEEVRDAREAAVSAEQRGTLARTLVQYSLFAIFLLILATFSVLIWALGQGASDSRINNVLPLLDKVLAAFFPLVGAWVGAVVAFYFARENFDTATRSAQILLRHEPAERLANQPVTGAMIKIADVFKQQGPRADLEALKLEELKSKMEASGRQRMPLLFDNGAGWAVLHLSRLREFLEKLPDPAARAAATIKTLAEHPDYVAWLPKSVAFIARDASLADALRVLAQQRAASGLGCGDIFVTQTGKASEQVIGLVTDVDLEKQSAKTVG